jgi:hypothetical protein
MNQWPRRRPIEPIGSNFLPLALETVLCRGRSSFCGQVASPNRLLRCDSVAVGKCISGRSKRARSKFQNQKRVVVFFSRSPRASNQYVRICEAGKDQPNLLNKTRSYRLLEVRLNVRLKCCSTKQHLQLDCDILCVCHQDRPFVTTLNASADLEHQATARIVFICGHVAFRGQSEVAPFSLESVSHSRGVATFAFIKDGQLDEFPRFRGCTFRSRFGP